MFIALSATSEGEGEVRVGAPSRWYIALEANLLY